MAPQEWQAPGMRLGFERREAAERALDALLRRGTCPHCKRARSDGKITHTAACPVREYEQAKLRHQRYIPRHRHEGDL